MGQRQSYNSIHKPQRSPNETIGFNQDDHPYRMCNETGIPEFLELGMLWFNQDDHPYRMCSETGILEFLELQIPEIPMVMMVMSHARSLHDPTQQDFINAHTLPIYKCHTCFKF